MKKIICTLLTASILISGCGSTYNLYPINSEGAAKVNENTQGRKGKVSLHGEDLEAVNIHLEVDSLDWKDPDPEGQTFTGTVENGDYFIFLGVDQFFAVFKEIETNPDSTILLYEGFYSWNGEDPEFTWIYFRSNLYDINGSESYYVYEMRGAFLKQVLGEPLFEEGEERVEISPMDHALEW